MLCDVKRMSDRECGDVRCLTDFISSQFYCLKVRFYTHNWNIYISGTREAIIHMTHDCHPAEAQLWSSIEVLQDKTQHLQLMRYWEHWRHVGESTVPVLTLTDTQTKSHQDIEDHCLQEEHTKSCDHQRHQVHHRVWGQQHCKNLVPWRSAASHLQAVELIRTGLQSVVAVNRSFFIIWNT